MPDTESWVPIALAAVVVWLFLAGWWLGHYLVGRW